MSDYDLAKEAANLAKHGISLSRWIELDIKITFEDDRFEYGETRYRLYGLIDGVAYCFVFTIRDGKVRPISLRRAHTKEMKRYAP
ncbi:MAG: BrnT family toxin [Nitrobacter sp.]